MDKDEMTRISQQEADKNVESFPTQVKKNNRAVMYVALLLASVIVVGTFLFFKGEQTALEGKIDKIQDDYKAYKAQSELGQQKIDSIGGVIEDMELRTTLREQEIARLSNSLSTIKYRNEKIRDSVRTLPLSGRFSFFASWLSEIDSLPGR
jgi:uncharacterized protein HemX